jgi:hypothetical protein
MPIDPKNCFSFLIFGAGFQDGGKIQNDAQNKTK